MRKLGEGHEIGLEEYSGDERLIYVGEIATSALDEIGISTRGGDD
jgi:hypothetical protein